MVLEQQSMATARMQEVTSGESFIVILSCEVFEIREKKRDREKIRPGIQRQQITQRQCSLTVGLERGLSTAHSIKRFKMCGV